MKLGNVEYTQNHGTLYRVHPKRDKSVSARQAKKAARAYRRSDAANLNKYLEAVRG